MIYQIQWLNSAGRFDVVDETDNLSYAEELRKEYTVVLGSKCIVVPQNDHRFINTTYSIEGDDNEY